MSKTHESYFLRFPMATVLFGKTFPSECETVFDYDEENDVYRFQSVTSCTNGQNLDLSYLTHNLFFVKMVAANKKNWNKTEEWYYAEDNNVCRLNAL